MLRNLNQVVAGRRVLDLPKTGVLGSIVAGVGGTSYLFDDITTQGLATSEVRGRIESTTIPANYWSASNLGVLNYSSAPEGLYSITYRLYIFGVPQGLASEPVLVGNPAPILVVQPSNETATAGTRAQFLVGAYGNNLTYQWLSGPTSTGPWANVTTGIGATSAVFNTGITSVSGSTPDTDGTYYKVVVSNSVGVVTSGVARLTVTASQTTAPSFVGYVVASNVTNSSYTLSWPTATDDGVIARYEYSLNHGAWTSVGNVTSYPFTGRAYGSVDLIEVRAVDNDGNPSSNLSTTVQLQNLSLLLTGPSAGTVNVSTANFIVSVTGPFTGALTVTPTDGGAGGSFTPASLQLTSSNSTGSFAYTPLSIGTKNISVTNDRGFINPNSSPLVVGAATSTSTLPATNLATLLDIRAYTADSNVRRSAAAFSLNFASYSGLSTQNMTIDPGTSKVHISSQSLTTVTVLRTSVPLTVTLNFRDTTNTTRAVNKLLILDDDIASIVMANGTTTAAQVSVIQG